MTQENIEKARQQFVKASKEFKFTFISPYPLDEKINLFAFGFIDGYGSKSGAIITLEEPPQYEADKNVVEWCQKHDRWLSQINIEPLLGEYDSFYFQELLDDWKKVYPPTEKHGSISKKLALRIDFVRACAKENTK